jgi:hypothetical protein
MFLSDITDALTAKEIKEAANAQQQAAIAIKMKNQHKTPKNIDEHSDDTVTFGIDSENAYNQVMTKFGKAITCHGDDMVAPRKYWAAIQQLAHDAGGAAEETGHEQDVGEDSWHGTGDDWHGQGDQWSGGGNGGTVMEYVDGHMVPNDSSSAIPGTPGLNEYNAADPEQGPGVDDSQSPIQGKKRLDLSKLAGPKPMTTKKQNPMGIAERQEQRLIALRLAEMKAAGYFD